jgi:hypothetical protein
MMPYRRAPPTPGHCLSELKLVIFDRLTACPTPAPITAAATGVSLRSVRWARVFRTSLVDRLKPERQDLDLFWVLISNVTLKWCALGSVMCIRKYEYRASLNLLRSFSSRLSHLLLRCTAGFQVAMRIAQCRATPYGRISGVALFVLDSTEGRQQGEDVDHLVQLDPGIPQSCSQIEKVELVGGT